jgi:glycosyltransferase involved in cell wall biosynthesis
MKKISIVIPTFNEEGNIHYAYEKVSKVMKTSCDNYDYEIIFIDNFSTDGTRSLLKDLCKKDSKVKVILNAKNFGFTRSTYYGMLQSTGDCTVLIFCDMQDPPELITDFIKQWEAGYKIVVGIKKRSQENRIMYAMRSAYYKLIKKIGEIDHIEQFTGFGLYDKSFIEVLRNLRDPMPYLRGIVAELGYERYEISYEQEKRKYGKSGFSFFKLYDVAMLGITSYSKVVMRCATIIGFSIAIISFLVAILTLILKLFNWDYFNVGMAAIITGIFLMGSIQLFFIGLVGEYILNINTRVMSRPLVIEEERINFYDGK